MAHPIMVIATGHLDTMLTADGNTCDGVLLYGDTNCGMYAYHGSIGSFEYGVWFPMNSIIAGIAIATSIL